MSIYVERLIRAPLDSVWSHTQDPDLHRRWDLRFTSIDYLPRDRPDAPQRFRYATRLGFGISIVGEGASLGQRELPDGSSSSSLWFGSAQARSLIREGRGYWKYTPTPDGVRFITSFDYSTRLGFIGRLLDRAIFRPLMGWATAWSFDRLRLWLEDGLTPERTARQAAAHGLARVGLAGIFLFQGLVPKVLGPDPTEIALVSAIGTPDSLLRPAVLGLGILEIVAAAALLATWHRPWLPTLLAAFALASTIVVILAAPGTLTAAFNPVTLAIGVTVLALLDRLTLDGIPSAGRCSRRSAGHASADAATPVHALVETGADR